MKWECWYTWNVSPTKQWLWVVNLYVVVVLCTSEKKSRLNIYIGGGDQKIRFTKWLHLLDLTHTHTQPIRNGEKSKKKTETEKWSEVKWTNISLRWRIVCLGHKRNSIAFSYLWFGSCLRKKTATQYDVEKSVFCKEKQRIKNEIEYLNLKYLNRCAK